MKGIDQKTKNISNHPKFEVKLINTLWLKGCEELFEVQTLIGQTKFLCIHSVQI